MAQFITALEAAELVDGNVQNVFPGTNLGNNEFVTKGQVTKAGKFDVSKIPSTKKDGWFIETGEIAKGEVHLVVAIQGSFCGSSDFNRIRVQIDEEEAGYLENTAHEAQSSDLSKAFTLPINSSVTLTAEYKNGSSRLELIGWFLNGSLTAAQSGATYQFTMGNSDTTVVLKGNYLEVSPTSLTFEAAGGTNTIEIKSNITDWRVQ